MSIEELLGAAIETDSVTVADFPESPIKKRRGRPPKNPGAISEKRPKALGRTAEEKRRSEEVRALADGIGPNLATMLVLISIYFIPQGYQFLAPTQDESAAIIVPLLRIGLRHSKISGELGEDWRDANEAITACASYGLRVGLIVKELREMYAGNSSQNSASFNAGNSGNVNRATTTKSDDIVANALQSLGFGGADESTPNTPSKTRNGSHASITADSSDSSASPRVLSADVARDSKAVDKLYELDAIGRKRLGIM